MAPQVKPKKLKKIPRRKYWLYGCCKKCWLKFTEVHGRCPQCGSENVATGEGWEELMTVGRYKRLEALNNPQIKTVE